MKKSETWIGLLYDFIDSRKKRINSLSYLKPLKFEILDPFIYSVNRFSAQQL